MHSRLLDSGLPRSLPPLPPSPAPPCLPCIEGRQRAAPHSSSFPPTTAPLQTLHMDVGGEFSSNLLRDFCRGDGITQSFTLPASPHHNKIAKHRIGLVMEVAPTSMFHAAAPHFLWSFAVRYAAHQLNLRTCVSLSEISPTLRWTGEVGDASVFWVWGSHAFVCDSSVDKLCARAILCVFLGFPPNAPGWQFYHPTSRRVLSSKDVTFEKSVPFYHLSPYRSAPPPPLPLFLAPGPPPVDPLPPQGPATSTVSQVDPLSGTVPVEVAGDSGAARGTASGGASLGALSLRVLSLGVLNLRLWSLGVACLRVLSLGVLILRVRSLGVLSLGVLLCLEVLLVLRRDCLPGQSISPHSSCVSGLLCTHAIGVELPELDPREALELEVLELLLELVVSRGTTAAGSEGACTRGNGAARTGGVEGARAGDPMEPRVTGAKEPLGAASTMAGPEERGGRGACGSGEAQAQGQHRDSAMAPVQPSLGPPRDEPRVFGLDKFNGDNFAEWSFEMENIFDHYDLLEVMEGTEKHSENDPEKSPWVRKSTQGYLLLGQALGSSQIHHIKPFQREPEKGPKAWAALKGVHTPAIAAVVVVLERKMAALRIEEDEAVEEGVQKFFDLLTRLEGADLKYSELQKKAKLLALLPESWSLLIINLNRDLPRLSLEDVKRAFLQEDFRRRELASADGAGAASIGRGYGCGRGRGRGGGRFGSNNFNGRRGSGGYGSDNKSYGRGRGRFDSECDYCHKNGHVWRDCYKLPD
ncbi:unnamed protein product [Closterium sp. NIES-54]